MTAKAQTSDDLFPLAARERKNLHSVTPSQPAPFLSLGSWKLTTKCQTKEKTLNIPSILASQYIDSPEHRCC